MGDGNSENHVKHFTVEISVDEHEKRTRAKARLDWRGKPLVGVGLAHRNPTDYNVSEIGDELATARALSDLGHQLLVVAASDIEAVTCQPVNPLS